MAGLRFQLDLYVNESLTGTVVAGVKIPVALADKVPVILQAVKDLKSYATKINAGKVNEEMTVRAVYHKCYHNEATSKPCEPEIAI